MGFQKNEYFWGYKDFGDISLGHHKIRLYIGVISMLFGVFSQGQGTEWGICFGVAKISIFWGMLEIPDILWGEG